MEHTLTEMINYAARQSSLLTGVLGKEQEREIIDAILNTLLQLDQHGGMPYIRHRKLNQIRYKNRMENDPVFRQNRLQYYREYYQQNRDRIKVRNVVREIQVGK